MFIPGPAEMGRVLAVVDALGIHREAVRIPLETTPGGSLEIENGRLVVILPEEGEIDGFVAGLSSRIDALPGRAALRPAEG